MDYIDFYTPGKYSNAASSIIAVDTETKKLLFAIEDERLLRRKYNLYEGNSRGWMLNKLKEYSLDNNPNIKIIDTQGLTNDEMFQLQSEQLNIVGAVRGHYVAERDGNHHLFHALNAYAQSGYKDATIIVLDGYDYDEGYAIGIYKAKGDHIVPIKMFSAKYSLGIYYALGCIMCGFGWNEGGKLMGLSSYARDTLEYDQHIYPMFELDYQTGTILKEYISFDQREYINESPSARVYMMGKLTKQLLKHGGANSFEELIHRSFSMKNAPLAAYFQWSFERTVFELVHFAAMNGESDNLILTGGCALNCVANGQIMRSGIFENVFIPPQCDDSGNALGAAIHRFGIKVNEPLVYNRITYPVPKEYNKEITSKDVADWIESGKIVAWFEGGSEYGPRALCHRSLLADPSLPYISYRLNEIKNRDYWRPLAPVVLDKAFKEFFEPTDVFLEERKYKEPHKYMLATEYFKYDCRLDYPAVCAPDGSTRPQVLLPGKQNDTLYNIMKDYQLPILVNTSMNTRGEPICETPEDAIKFCTGKPDVMLVFVKDGKIFTKGTQNA